jgi:hypothetical protein
MFHHSVEFSFIRGQIYKEPNFALASLNIRSGTVVSNTVGAQNNSKMPRKSLGEAFRTKQNVHFDFYVLHFLWSSKLI